MKSILRSFQRSLFFIATTALCVWAVSAAEPVSSTTRPSIYDQIWKHAELYKNPDNPVIQSIAFTGRYQLDYAILDHDDFEQLNTRRWRMGPRVRFFENFTLHAEVELDHDEDPWYQRLTEASLSWSRSNAFKFTTGKHSAPFTLDGMTSSKELLTIDRSNLGNNIWFPLEYFPGVSASGRIDNWRYHSGAYSSGSASREFGNFDGKFFLLNSLGHDFARALTVKQALLTAAYIYQEPDRNNTFTRPLKHIGSLNFQYDTGRWGFRSEVAGATGALGQSDLWGAVIMPFYNITKKLQMAARYTYLSSAQAGGIRFNRYESQVVSGRGDNYHEVYSGLSYFIYGHKLKVQTGVQHVQMDDDSKRGGSYRGWAWTTGLRVSW
jgi:phosphate-selective porin OprO and OprP